MTLHPFAGSVIKNAVATLLHAKYLIRAESRSYLVKNRINKNQRRNITIKGNVRAISSRLKNIV
jgi:hypothetical protein